MKDENKQEQTYDYCSYESEVEVLEEILDDSQLSEILRG